MNTKQLLLSLACMLAALTVNAQDDASKRPSPPAQAKATVGGKTITINYSQPAAKGREIFGKLVPYDKVWRTGANETTTIEFSDDVTLEGKSVPKGRYALFTIPTEKDWTIIINKGIKWGAFTYKQDEDVVRVTVPSKKTATFAERMAIAISPQGVVSISWADKQADFTVK